MYFICEVQTTNNVGTMLPPLTAETIQDAESKYHQILAYAAISSVQKHGAIIFNDECLPIMSQCYKHGEAVNEGN